MGNNWQTIIPKYRDWLGVAFFLFATGLAIHLFIQQPSLLSGLNVIHNGLLTFFYTKRLPVKSYDRVGLWLGMIAAFLPFFSLTTDLYWFSLLPALFGYFLILYSLFTLGPRFGIAPADRGLTCRGPYLWIRHPMYAGELLFRLVLILSAKVSILSVLQISLLFFIQILRIYREEALIDGYGCYQKVVRWRLVPGVW
jgi:protein-S-isoprenylcysteine O-methyltransferase Ste14